MRVLIPVFSMVSYRAPPKTVYNLVRGLSSQDVDVTLLVAEVDDNFKFPKKCKVNISLSKSKTEFFKNIRELRKRCSDADVIYTPISKEALFLSKISRNSEVPIIAGPNIDAVPYLKHKITNISCNLYIVYARYVKKIYSYIGLDEEKIRVLPHAVDVEFYSPAKKDRNFWSKFGLNNTDKKIILFVGRLEKKKGILNLIKSFLKYIHPEYSSATLVVVSSGGTYENYVTQVSLNNSNSVIFIKMLPEKLMPIAYASADIGVFPSEREGFGMVYLESMASGTPTIGVDAGGPREIIRSWYDGILIPDNSEKSIYKAVSAILEDEKMQKKIGCRGREKVERVFSPVSIAKKFINICLEVVE